MGVRRLVPKLMSRGLTTVGVSSPWRPRRRQRLTSTALLTAANKLSPHGGRCEIKNNGDDMCIMVRQAAPAAVNLLATVALKQAGSIFVGSGAATAMHLLCASYIRQLISRMTTSHINGGEAALTSPEPMGNRPALRRRIALACGARRHRVGDRDGAG